MPSGGRRSREVTAETARLEEPFSPAAAAAAGTDTAAQSDASLLFVVLFKNGFIEIQSQIIQFTH